MYTNLIVALAINILRKTRVLPENTVFPEVDPCSLCGEDLYSAQEFAPFKEFTLASCGDIFHQKCLEKYLVNGEAICPNKKCNKAIETFLSPELLRDDINKEKNNNDKELGLEKPSADETNTTASTVATSKQVDSENQTPVDDITDPLELEKHVEAEPEVIVEQSGVESGEDDDDADNENVNKNADEEVEIAPEESEEASSTNKNKKRANTSTDKPSSKKAKTKVEESRVLKNLIRELSIGTLKVSEVREKEGLFRLQQEVGNSRIFLTLYSKITNAEDKHENSNQELIRAYHFFGEALSRRLDHHKKANEEHEAQRLVNDEVKKQLPKEVTKVALRKKTERARKIYDLFRRIGSDKIQRVRSFSALSIAKLGWDKIDYVVREVCH